MLTIGISTLKSNKNKLIDYLIYNIEKVPPSINFLIVSQQEDCDSSIQINKNIELINSTSVGLSFSRNIVISNTNSKWLWFQDDDITLNFEQLYPLLNELKNSQSDIVFTKIKSLENVDEFYKNYDFHQTHSILNAIKISSIEIIVQPRFINEQNINFDLKLGLGTNMPCCEENKFVLNVFKVTDKVCYLDLSPCYHTTKIETRNIDHSGRFVARGYFLNFLPLYISSLLIFRWAWNIKCNLSFSQKLKLMIISFIKRK